VGIDLSPEMIHQAVDLAEGIENVRFEVGDAEGLPFGVGSSRPCSAPTRSITIPIHFKRCVRWLAFSLQAVAS